MTNEAAPLAVSDLASSDRDWATELITAHFGSPTMVSRGTIHDTRSLPALVPRRDGRRVGLLVYSVVGQACEIVALVAARPRQGIGRSLAEALTRRTEGRGWNRLWAVTTNDNAPALAFYRSIRWRLVKIHQGAVNEARRLKPQIPRTGWNGVPIGDEIEFELRLTNRGRDTTTVKT